MGGLDIPDRPLFHPRSPPPITDDDDGTEGAIVRRHGLIYHGFNLALSIRVEAKREEVRRLLLLRSD